MFIAERERKVQELEENLINEIKQKALIISYTLYIDSCRRERQSC